MPTIRTHVNYRPGSCRSAPLASPSIASRRPLTPCAPERRSRPEPSRDPTRCPDRAPRPVPANDDDADAGREVPLTVPFEGRGPDRRYPDPLDAPPVHPEHYVGSMELYEASHARIVAQRTRGCTGEGTRERVHASRDGRYTIYAILDPVTGEAVYVGQTGDMRARRGKHLAFWRGRRAPRPTLLISCWLVLLGRSPLARHLEDDTVAEARRYERGGRYGSCGRYGNDAGYERPGPSHHGRAARASDGPLSGPPAPVFRTLGHAGTLLEALEAETDWIERLGAARHRLLNGGYHRGAARQAWPGGVRGFECPAGWGEPRDREAEGGAGKGA